MGLWNWCIDCNQQHTLLGVFIWRSKTHRKTAILVCIDLCDNWQVSTFTTGPRSNCVRGSTKSLSQSIDTESLSTSLSSSSVINRIKLWLTVLATSLIYRCCQGQYIIFFLACERAEFSKSYNLIGSGSGRKFSILPAHRAIPPG